MESSNSQTRMKLFLGLGLIIVILAVVIGASYLSLATITRTQESLYQQKFAAALALKDMRANQNGIREDMLGMMLDERNLASRKTRLQDIKSRVKDIARDVEKARAGLKDSPALLAKFEELELLRKDFEKTRDEKVIPSILNGKTADAKELSLGIQTERNNKIRAGVDELSGAVEKTVEEQIASSMALSRNTVMAFIGLAILALLVVVGLAFFVNRLLVERGKVEARLRETSAYSRSLLEASLDPLVTISPEGKITDVNKATEEVTGFTRERLVGSDFSDYFTDPVKAREGYQKVISEGLVRNYPLTVRHISGRTAEVLYNAAVYADERGKMQGVFAAARDITERKRAEENLKRVMIEVQESVNVLAPASSEILNITSQVAAAASETATAVSETTTTVEEVKQTAIMANQKAQYVAEIAQKTAAASEAGKKSVGSRSMS